MKKIADKDQPWISNYPPLHAWIMGSRARCDWQVKQGSSMVEQWRLPNGRAFIVTVMSERHGWEIYVPASESTRIRDTLLAVGDALGVPAVVTHDAMIKGATDVEE